MDNACENTDRELWRETPGDAYSPSIHVTKEGGIGINVGGTVFVMDVRDWHLKASKEFDADMKRLALADQDAKARRLYADDTGNHPTVHANRFPAWDELPEAERQKWRFIAANR